MARCGELADTVNDRIVGFFEILHHAVDIHHLIGQFLHIGIDLSKIFRRVSNQRGLLFRHMQRFLNGLGSLLGVTAQFLHDRRNIFGGLFGLFRKLPDLFRDNRKTFSCLACSCRFDRRV